MKVVEQMNTSLREPSYALTYRSMPLPELLVEQSNSLVLSATTDTQRLGRAAFHGELEEVESLLGSGVAVDTHDAVSTLVMEGLAAATPRCCLAQVPIQWQ